jgi:hypothetical protein
MGRESHRRRNAQFSCKPPKIISLHRSYHRSITSNHAARRLPLQISIFPITRK